MKPPQELAKHLKHAQANAPEDAIVKVRTLLGWMAKIITLLPTPSRGIDVRRSLHGDIWTAGSGDLSAGGTVNANGTVSAYTIGGVMPTIGGDRLDDSYTPLTIGSGTVHVIATITATLADLGGAFIQSLAVTTVTLATSGTDPGPSGLVSSTGTFEVLQATFQDGAKTYQRQTGDWSVDVIDDRTGAGSCTLVRI